ncbi:putative aminodeoxychorismate synthase, chloroplastic, partial [Curcuma longa]
MTINHGLRKSLLHERKVAHACQSSEKFPRTELLQKATIKQFVNIHGTSTVLPTLIGDKYLRLQWKKFGSLLGEVGGSENIFHKLFGDHNLDNTFWLDSSSTDQGRARFSFMGGKGGSLWKQLTFFLCDNTRDCQVGHEKSKTTDKVGGYLTIEDGNGSFKTDFIEDGLFDFLDKELQSFIYDKRDYQELPFDFCCGYIGYLG